MKAQPEMVRKALEEILNELAIQRAFAKKRGEGYDMNCEACGHDDVVWSPDREEYWCFDCEEWV